MPTWGTIDLVVSKKKPGTCPGQLHLMLRDDPQCETEAMTLTSGRLKAGLITATLPLIAVVADWPRLLLPKPRILGFLTYPRARFCDFASGKRFHTARLRHLRLYLVAIGVHGHQFNDWLGRAFDFFQAISHKTTYCHTVPRLSAGMV